MMLRAWSGLGLLAAVGLLPGCYITVDDDRLPGSSGAVTGSGGGAVTGSGGAGGSGGLSGQCTLPPEAGPCDAAIPKYWHDTRNGVCMPFIYGGCEGNANRFDSLEECQRACQGGSPDMDTCAAPGECVLARTQICGACEPYGARDLVAVNRAMKAQYEATVGISSDFPCAPWCEPCAVVGEAERTSQFFAAACESGHCTVVDVRESPLTECKEDADCILRDGVACCEGCDGTGIVAINASADLLGMVCPDDFGACPPCAPLIPKGIRAVCSEGRCQREFVAAP